MKLLKRFLCVKQEGKKKYIVPWQNVTQYNGERHIQGGVVMDGRRETDEDTLMFKSSKWPHKLYKASFLSHGPHGNLQTTSPSEQAGIFPR